MNYIHRLEDEQRLASAELCGLRSGIEDLRRYLSSPKFHEDTTVQVKDIFMRLEEAERFALQLRDEQEKTNKRRIDR